MGSPRTPPEPALEALYEDAVRLHGHMCPGVVLGVRMAVVGMRELGLDPYDPGQDLRVTVETQRCATDAVQAATRCSLGRGSLVLRDFGKMAATFSMAGSARAVRVRALDSSREEADRLFPGMEGKHARQTAAYRVMDDAELFEVRAVTLAAPSAGHGKPSREKARCSRCGEEFEAAKGRHEGGQAVCANCAGPAYFAPAGP